ncbi:MAG: F0F1 ATP synthase subunit delta [Patescibacteria group bacterium]
MSARVSSHHYAEALLRLSQQDVGDAALSVAVDRVADELVRAGRAAWLDQVLAAFTRLAGADLGRREVHVTSPQPLRDTDAAIVADAAGVVPEALDLREHMDASLLAGGRIAAGDKIVAGSVRDRLDRLFE